MRARAQALLGMGVALTLGLLASALPEDGWRGGRPAPAPAVGGAGLSSDPDLLHRLLLAAAGLMLAATAAALATRQGRRELASRVAAGLVLVGLVLGLMPLARAALPLATRPAPPTAPAEAPAAAGDAAGAFTGRTAPPAEPPAPPPPPWLAAGAGAALAAATAWAAWHAARVRRRHAPAATPSAPAARPVLPAATGPGDARAVVRCWLRMVELLSARSYWPPAPALTAREYAAGLAARGFRHPAIGRLTELFEQVRYGRHADAVARAEAEGLLAELERVYGRG